MIRAVLFDFNGVLVDDEPLHLEMFQRVLRDEGIELSAADYYDRYLGFDDRGCFAAVLEEHGQAADPLRLVRLIARKASYYQQRVHSGGYPFFPGAADLVKEIAATGRMLGVVSGALREEIEGALEQERLLDCFKIVVAAEDVTEGKPSPEGYRKGLDALNTLPPLPERLIHHHEVLAVEDSPAGLSAAQAAGLRTLGIAQTYPSGQLTQADAVVERFAGLSLSRLEELFH